jgi:hypothetical protein
MPFVAETPQSGVFPQKSAPQDGNAGAFSL